MSNWRPKGWVSPYQVAVPFDPAEVMILRLKASAYEAGADALLEALKERGVYCRLDVFSFRGCDKGDEPSEFAPQVGPGHFGKCNDKGWLVFIPDEEEKG